MPAINTQNNMLASASVQVEFMGEYANFCLDKNANIISISDNLVFKRYLIALLEDAADYLRKSA